MRTSTQLRDQMSMMSTEFAQQLRQSVESLRSTQQQQTLQQPGGAQEPDAIQP